jgi:hypothetical protein
MIRLIGAVLLCLCVAVPSWAAVAFDAASECTTNAATSLTCTHVSAGSDRAGYCAITHENGSTDVSSVTATWNGVTMDIVFTDTATHASKHTRLFRLAGQATGSQSVVFDWGGASRAFSAVCGSFTGVDQADPDDAQVVVTNDLSGGTTDSVSSAAGDMALDILVTASSLNSAVDGAQGNTLINALFDGQTANGLGMSYEAGAASVTTGWTWTGLANYVHWQININASSGGGGGSTGGGALLNMFRGRLQVNP